MVSLPDKSDFCYGELGNKWSSVGSEIGDIKCVYNPDIDGILPKGP